jgi:hypothetical protein
MPVVVGASRPTFRGIVAEGRRDAGQTARVTPALHTVDSFTCQFGRHMTRSLPAQHCAGNLPRSRGRNGE